MSVKLYVMTHKPFTPPKDPMYVPLHVGRANAADLGFMGDDSGDSISAYNPYFCELTGMYWVWKNDFASDYIGICHYRRYLLNAQGRIFTKEQILNLLSEYDILTTKLLTLTCPYQEGFSQNHHAKDLIVTGDVLAEKYPAYAPAFQKALRRPHTYFGNLFITSREQYDRYCAFLFDVLFEVQKRTDFTGYNDYEKRLFGFLSEFLQTVFLQHNKLRVCECMAGMVGEKYETKKLRKQLAEYLEKRAYQEAKDCFLTCYQKRPDVLMEASDVTGELRLCMQIISTCSFEEEAYQRCILDDIRKYDDLIRHFRRLNRVVLHVLSDSLRTEDALFFRQNPYITPVATEIAVTLFCKDPAEKNDVIKKLASLRDSF